MENIKLNALLFKTLFLLLTFWTSPALGQTSIGCNMDGECKGSLFMDVSSQETVGDCLEQCQATIGCQYWTYYRESKGCLGFVNCDHLTAEDCTDCVSGDKGCEPYQCDIQGRCSGTLEEFLVAPSSDYCADKCHEHVNCTWWTYDSSSTRFCTLLADCPILDKSCLSCISGEAGCWVESTLPPDTEDFSTLMLVGGAQESGLGTNEVEVIDLTGQGLSCDSLSPFPYDIEEASSVTLDGIVYICGGYGTNFTDTYQIYGACYKFEGNDWIWVSDLLEPRRRAAAVAMDGFIWIAGGFNEALQTSKTSEIIFPNGTVIWGTQMPIPLEWHCMNPVTDTKVILSGGFNSQFGSTRRTLLFDFTDSSWTELDQMTDQRYGHSCEIIQSAERGSEILVAGGGSVTSSTESFNLNSKKWTIGPHLPKGIAFSTSVPFNDTMVLIGGEVYGEEGYNSLYEYDPSNESWILRPETISGTKFKASAEVLGASDVSCTLLK